MTTYVAFLRAINLGATRKFPKAAIVEATEGAGFTDVATHINTGNVRLATRMRSRPAIEQRLEDAYRERAGFEVPTIVVRAAEVAEIVAVADRLEHPGPHYVSLMKADPDPEQVASIQAHRAEAGVDERLHVEGRAAHLMLAEGYQASRLTNTQVERFLGVSTNRNLTVLRAIAEKWR